MQAEWTVKNKLKFLLLKTNLMINNYETLA